METTVPETPARPAPSATEWMGRFLHVLIEPRSYLNPLYLLTAFPLGLTYLFILMCSAAATADSSQPVAFGPLVLDPVGHRATLAGSALDLSRREMDLLELLLQHPGRTFSREFSTRAIVGIGLRRPGSCG